MERRLLLLITVFVCISLIIPQSFADLEAAAKKLGVSVADLRDALGPPPPDLEAAAAKLSVTVEQLRDALGLALTGENPPGGQGGVGDSIWNRTTLAEEPAFDEAGGHQPESGEYHHHRNPVALRLQLNDNINADGTEKQGNWTHSPILGWAFDGFPIYGPYGYADANNPKSSIKRIQSSYQSRNIRQRRTLPDGTQLSPEQYGPDVSEDYPVGWYVEDHEFITGSGDLDQHNGRFCKTTQYPNGTYAYFITIDVDGHPVFPFILGPTYYGVVSADNMAGGGGNVREAVEVYFAANCDNEAKSVGPINVEDAIMSSLILNNECRHAIVQGQTTWPGNDTPQFADILEVRYSAENIYINTNGLAGYDVGPWPGNPNYPTNQQNLIQLPRQPQQNNAEKTATRLGAIGVWVNGISVFNYLDAFSWDNDTQRDASGGMSDTPPQDLTLPSPGDDGSEESTTQLVRVLFSDVEKVRVDQEFEFEVQVSEIEDLAGWELNLHFDSAIIEITSVQEGSLTKTAGDASFFQDGEIDNGNGVVRGLVSAYLKVGGIRGSGSILHVSARAKAEGVSFLRLENASFGNSAGNAIPIETVSGQVIVIAVQPCDVNADGEVNIFDLILVAQKFSQLGVANDRTDVNRDGKIDIFDLILVAQCFGQAKAAPTIASSPETIAEQIEMWIAIARSMDDGSAEFRKGIAALEGILASLPPTETVLLPNYPNPFNPETWIPYQLADDAEVQISIYDISGKMVRRLNLGHKPAGYYVDRGQAVYWDGKSETGEQVSSGLYFYQLRAGDFTSVKRLVILK